MTTETLKKDTAKEANKKESVSTEKETTLKKDLVGSAIIGVVAALFSLIVIKNLSIPLPLWAPFVIFPGMTVSGIVVGRFLGKKLPIMYKFVKFGEAGGMNWLVDFGALNLLILLTGISAGIWYSVFKGISFIGATANSYGWNKYWVFESKAKDQGTEAFKFLVSTGLGMLVNVIVASLIVFAGPKIMPTLESKVVANIGAAVGSLIAMGWNFLMYRFWVFK